MEDLIQGFLVASTLTNLLYCFFGVTIGTLLGVLPGIGTMAAVSLLMPLTFYLDPTTGIIMLAGVYYGTEYGGSTASILLNLPGTPASAITCLDGHAMAKNGRAGSALFIAAVGSFVGGTTGILMLMLLSPMVVAIALSFGPGEYFAMILIGLITAGGVTQGSPIKGLAMVVLGLLLGMMGSDVNSGVIRFNLGTVHLYDGINIVILAMGLFGIPEVINSINGPKSEVLSKKISLRSMLPTRDELKKSIMPILRGTGIGGVIGPLPGTGPALASFLSYAVEKRVAQDPGMFGNGAIQGVAGPETANNAAAQTAFVPTLTMAIPGTATMALMLGVLLTHGIAPGPTLMTQHADLFWGVVASFWIGNILLLILNIPMIGVWVRILQIPYKFLYPTIICLICIGVYSVNNEVYDIVLVMVVGAAGYLLRYLGFEPAPILIGFVLGPLIEENLRRALLISRGSVIELFERPIGGTLLVIAITLLIWIVWSEFRRRSEDSQVASNSAGNS